MNEKKELNYENTLGVMEIYFHYLFACLDINMCFHEKDSDQLVLL
jgi:hypothetical protein